MTKCTTLATNN